MEFTVRFEQLVKHSIPVAVQATDEQSAILAARERLSEYHPHWALYKDSATVSVTPSGN